jgi:DNA ligase (NAD+)
VVKVNALRYREEMGDVGAVPRWAVAFKYPPENVKTTVLDIAVQVGRTGVLTPKAILKPVAVAGSIVSAATLHNIDYIKEKDIRIGDTVILRKAGDIIPEIVSVVKEERPDGAAPFEMPEVCPSCGGRVTREDDEAAVRCTDSACPAQLLRNVTHFVERQAMDIETLGESTAQRFIDEGFITSVADIYSLDKVKIASLPGMGEKSAANIIAAAEKSKTQPLSRLIYALGIRHVGEKAARVIAQRFLDIDELMKATEEQLQAIPDVGPETAKSIINFFSVDMNTQIIERLKAQGVNMTEQKEEGGPAHA